jgi:DNA-binding response OmpR family regulator
MKILVVDDDRVLADLIAFTFRREGYDVIQAHAGKTALRRWEDDGPDLIVLDVNLPDTTGFSLCRTIRADSTTPVILLTVRSDEDDIVHGLSIGADDYIAKPFSPRQLLARAQAVLRRTARSVHPAAREVGPLRLDPARRMLRLKPDREIPLTMLESQLLDCLMVNAGQVLPYDTIIDQVWGPEGATPSMVRQLVYRLRLKVEQDPSNPVHLHTVPGIGYELKPGPAPSSHASGPHALLPPRVRSSSDQL